MINFSTNVKNQDILEALDRLKASVEQTRPAMVEIAAEFESRAKARFETQTDPNGAPWAKHSAATKATYPKDGNRRILDRSGTMLDSAFHRADNTTAEVGFSAVASKNRDVYAAYHEFGTKTMPRRGILFANPDTGDISDADESAVLDILNDHIARAIR